MTSIFKLFTRLLACLALIFCMTASHKVMASHYAAGDMKVTLDTGVGRPPIDSNRPRYRIDLSVYKVCENLGGFINTDLYATEPIYVTSTNAGNGGVCITRTPGIHTPSISKPNNLDGRDSLDQLCGGIANSCKILTSPFPGFIRAHYIDTVTVPSRQTDWRFVWEDGSRNGGIMNLSAPNGIHLEDLINNTKPGRWDVVPPYYTHDPTPYLCVNQPDFFQNGPVDPQNDSIRTLNNNPQDYSAVTGCPYNGANYSYLSPYTLANPINSTTGYTVDPYTAKASFTPPNQGKFVVSFRTYKWDKVDSPHVLLAYTSRDVQILILPCSSTPPTIDSTVHGGIGYSQTDSTTINACPGVPMSFNVTLNSNNSSPFLVMRISGQQAAAPGSVFSTVLSGSTLTGTFSWTPTANDVGTHVIEFDGIDSTCNPGQSILLENSFVAKIKVNPGIDAGPDASVCPLGDRPYQLHVTGPNRPIYRWTDLNGNPAQYISCLTCNSPLVSPPVDYTYVVSSSDPLFVCKNADTVTIHVDNSNAVVAKPENLVVCRPGYIQFMADSVGPNPLQNLPCGTANPISCNVQDSVVLGSGTSSPTVPTNTPYYTQKKYSKYQFVIPRQEMIAAGQRSGTIGSISFLSINPTVVATNPAAGINIYMKCTQRTSYPSPAANGDFETGATLVATVGSYVIAPGQWNRINFATPYNWDTTQNLLVDICIGPIVPAPNANSDLFAVTAGSAIQRSDSVDVCATSTGPVTVFAQRPVVKFTYCDAPEAPWRYWWTPGRQLNDSNLKQPIAYVDRSTQYFIYGIGRNGCKVRDSLQIYVPVHHVYASPHDSFVCQGALVPLHATGGLTYQWYENGFSPATSLTCDNCSDPIARPQVTTTYTIVYNDDVDCHDTLYLTVNVWPSPTVVISTPDTTINYGSNITLYGNGAYSYTWTPVGSLSDPNIPNPVATPIQNTSYILYGLDRNGCQGTDTVNVKVNFSNRLMIPSGFTPNGDGKNDEFRVVNITNQRLIEFRVFNRWGQEIFSTTDATRGWDGTWKDVPQEMGVYQYLIRVGFADGIIETYKGDVTLIR